MMAGGASRFYYVAKPSREERDFGCYDLTPRSAGDATDRVDGSDGLKSPRAGAGRTGGARNIHPTVKPVELMRWLVRLVTPHDGLVLDPFTGSGTTGMACRYEQRRFVGIEREADYIAIAHRRIAEVAPLFSEAVPSGEAGTSTGRGPRIRGYNTQK
jgi:site-specific DNA-methyltransferase (adenine-specific)